VEKVLIDQESVDALANAVVARSAGPGISRIDFAKLDTWQIRLSGVYGDKGLLVNLLQDKGVIDEET
jgi:hypothetical protein